MMTTQAAVREHSRLQPNNRKRTIMEQSRKNDRLDGKLRWELLPLDTLEEVVKVFTFGAGKYGPNTLQGLGNGYERYKAALLRHLVSYEKGETHDPESGIHALAHMAWNAIAILHLELQKEKETASKDKSME